MKPVTLVPGLMVNLFDVMQSCPMRFYDPVILQEPHIYRMTEVCAHDGELVSS